MMYALAQINLSEAAKSWIEQIGEDIYSCWPWEVKRYQPGVCGHRDVER